MTTASADTMGVYSTYHPQPAEAQCPCNPDLTLDQPLDAE